MIMCVYFSRNYRGFEPCKVSRLRSDDQILRCVAVPVTIRVFIFFYDIFDGSRLISVILAGCFGTRNRDSDSAFSCDLTNNMIYSIL